MTRCVQLSSLGDLLGVCVPRPEEAPLDVGYRGGDPRWELGKVGLVVGLSKGSRMSSLHTGAVYGGRA